MSLRRALLLFAAALLIPACGGGADRAPGAPPPRTLGMHLRESEASTYDAAFQLARSVGVSAVPLLLTWKGTETAPGVYDGTLLDIMNVYYPAASTPLSLTIATLNTNVNELPPDLAALPFDDPAVIARFKKLLDFVFSRIPALTLLSLNIGNEVDMSLSGATAYQRYTTFFGPAAAYARSKRPGLKVGVVATLEGLTASAKPLLQSLNASSDIISLTYYPIGGTFKVRPPTVVSADVQAVLDAYPGVAVYFQEVGYPSSSVCGSTDVAQADFVREVFRVWDLHADRIPFLAFLTETDMSQAEVDALAAYYQLATLEFKEYLRTLGLRTWPGSGADKPGWTALKTEPAARGW